MNVAMSSMTSYCWRWTKDNLSNVRLHIYVNEGRGEKGIGRDKDDGGDGPVTLRLIKCDTSEDSEYGRPS